MSFDIRSNNGDINQEGGYLNYIDKNGKVIFISQGLSANEYGSFRKSESGGLHRVKSPMMPMVNSREQAQKNLDLWAQKNQLRKIKIKSK